MLTERGESDSGRLWQSADGGQTWTALAPPPFPFDTNYIVAQQPYTKQDWLICGADPSLGNMPSPPNQPNEIACTRNGGATWATHLLTIPAGTQIFPLLGIADDGSLLLKTVVAGTTTIPPDLYRVAPGASTVVSLGASPQVSGLAYPAYADGQGHGVLWLGPTGRTHDTDPQGRIFTATYS